MVNSKVLSVTIIMFSLLLLTSPNGFISVCASGGAYIVNWSSTIKHGAKLAYNLTKTIDTVPEWVKVNTTIQVLIDKPPSEVNFGFTGQNYCHATIDNTSIDKTQFPPIILPKYVFRVCCNAFKKISTQIISLIFFFHSASFFS